MNREMVKEPAQSNNANIIHTADAQSGSLQTDAEPKVKPFAYGLCYAKLFWIFMIGCFIGVVLETVLCLVNNHVLQNRSGVIYGPFNPIYGVGAVLMTCLLYPIAQRGDLFIFISSALIGGGFEYFCSFLQERIFGTVSWDYSYMPLNIDGRTNVPYMLFWGVLGLAWMKRVYPLLSSLIEKLPKRWGVVLTWALTIFMLLNMGISALAVERQAQRRAGIPPDNGFQQFLDTEYPDEMLEKIFPSMEPVNETAKNKQPT
ncbi:putative ABC transporter permease [Acetanaerobacterium elongatum]|uniref:Putative ABC-transporter type IV n=1 Tax=Acetanaerobacterium elongatum TaxID=258515 RepID=A0A1H0F2B6_9FIRM|nr:putative ABC transporter permease [Acetanaerobacterium elongatum]SDN88798.1 Putative ABC-transporter type IV [Acetanaerobacterium elongatum]